VEASRHLHAVDALTGEVYQDGCPACAEKETLIAQLQNEGRGKSLQIGNLKKKLADMRAVDDYAADIREVLAYAKETWGGRWSAVEGSKRWEKVRDRFKDKPLHRDPFTVEELKLAADSANRDEWLNGTDPNSKGYLRVETVYRDFEQVERLLAQLRCDCGCRSDEHAEQPDEFGWRACGVCGCAFFHDDGQRIEEAIWRYESRARERAA
jgi:hypothetical protein